MVLVGQSPQHVRLGIVSDWSHRHVLYPESSNYPLMTRIWQDPRYLQNWYLRHPGAWWPQNPPGRGGSGAGSQRDWSFSVGTGSVGGQTFPAKYVFDVTTTPSCTNDYVVTGINVAGSTTQASLVAVNNLYTGTINSVAGLCGTATTPSVLFAYNVRTGYAVRASVVPSLDGTKIAFVDWANGGSDFHVLTWTKGQGTVAAPVTPTAQQMSSFALGEATTNTIFVDYQHDAAYATAGTVMYKFSPVFNGTPAEVTTGGWPLTFTGAGTLSTPVYDQITRHVFVEDTDGTVRYADDSVSPAVVGGTTWAFSTTDTARPPIVDSTNGKVYIYSPNGTANSIVGQASMTLGSIVVADVGAKGANLAPLAPDFNNAYYTGGTPPLMYAVGTNGTIPALYAITFTGYTMTAGTAAHGPLNLATAAVDASSVTEFYNTTLAKDFLFVGTFGNCETTGVTGGCVRTLDITAGFPTSANPVTGSSNAILAAAGGTSGITVDNNSSKVEASSIYFVTMSTTGSTCGTGDYCLVKATQSGLN